MKTIWPESVFVLTMTCLLLAAAPGLAGEKKQADAGSDESTPATTATTATTAKSSAAGSRLVLAQCCCLQRLLPPGHPG